MFRRQRQPGLARTVLLMAMAASLAGCHQGEDAATTPTAPTAAIPPTVTASSPIAPPPSARIGVAGSAFKGMEGARVEILNGPSAGMSAITDAEGNAILSGEIDDATEFRASKDGYVTAVARLPPPCATCQGVRWFTFFLASTARPVDVTGNFTLTFVADTACNGLQDHQRTRTYLVTIAPAGNATGAPFYWAAASGASFVEGYSRFPVGVDGNFIGFWLGEHGAFFIEEISPGVYFEFDGWAEATVSTPAVTTISTTFAGVMGSCTSQQHQFILARR